MRHGNSWDQENAQRTNSSQRTLLRVITQRNQWVNTKYWKWAILFKNYNKLWIRIKIKNIIKNQIIVKSFQIKKSLVEKDDRT